MVTCLEACQTVLLSNCFKTCKSRMPGLVVGVCHTNHDSYHDSTGDTNLKHKRWRFDFEMLFGDMAQEQNQALSEEVESINAIYGDNTLAPSSSSNTYILTPSFHPTSLRISFPQTYPDVVPVILGPESTQSSLQPSTTTKKGDAAEFADLARQVLQSCFRAGEPCIFDLVEELKSQIEQRDYSASSTTDPASLSSDGEDSASETGYTSDSSSSAAATTGRTSTLGTAASGAVSAVYNALIRTHHVTSRKKVGKVKKMAVHELRYLLIRSGGSPGLMYAEGSEESLKGWIAGVSVCGFP